MGRIINISQSNTILDGEIHDHHLGRGLSSWAIEGILNMEFVKVGGLWYEVRSSILI